MTVDRRLAALAALSRAFAEAVPDLEALLRAVAERIALFTGDACTVRLLSEDGARLVPVAAHHPDPALARAIAAVTQQTVDTSRAGLWRPVLEERRLVRLALPPGAIPADASPEQVAFMQRYPMCGIMGAPLLARGRLLGGISLVRYGAAGAPFDDDDEAFLRDAADRAALAIDNARLLDAERSARAAAEASAQAVRALNAALEQRVAERTADLEAAVVALERASRHKSEFLAHMSHELRTPLNAIIGFSQLLLVDRGAAEFPPRARQEYLQHILDSGQHLLTLINEVLDLARVEAGRLELWLETVDVDEVVRGVLAALRPLADRKRLALAHEPAGGGKRVEPLEADAARLKQVLYNLVSNAITFTPEGGTVRVSVHRERGGVRLSVADTGPGIAPADQERIFEAFQQADSTLDRPAGGTGLGLALTRRLVELHGGRIWVESQPGTGSCFHVVLPRRAATRPRRAAGRAPRPPSPTRAAS